MRLGDNGETGGDTGDVQLVGGVLYHQLVTAWLRRWQEISAGMVRKIVVVAEDADQFVDAIVVWCNIGVADRPVIAKSIAALRFEVIGAKAERNATPVIGASPNHPCAPPHEVGSFGLGKRLAL